MTNAQIAHSIAVSEKKRPPIPDILLTDEERRQITYDRARESGISLGRTISEYAHTKGITFEEARKELKI